MPKFRKKPVTVDAFLLGSQEQAPTWVAEALRRRDLVATRYGFSIMTPEGKMIAEPGDWLVKGVKGELYSVKANIFPLTYQEDRRDPITKRFLGPDEEVPLEVEELNNEVNSPQHPSTRPVGHYLTLIVLSAGVLVLGCALIGAHARIKAYQLLSNNALDLAIITGDTYQEVLERNKSLGDTLRKSNENFEQLSRVNEALNKLHAADDKGLLAVKKADAQALLSTRAKLWGALDECLGARDHDLTDIANLRSFHGPVVGLAGAGSVGTGPPVAGLDAPPP